jgi:hypothetical protein
VSYALLIVEAAGAREARSEDQGRAMYDAMLRFSESLKARGMLRVSQSLRTEAQGVRVSVRDGRRTLIDGPFAEAKEMVGGFFLLECATRDEAVAIAAECPAAAWATIEVRELGPCFT